MKYLFLILILAILSCSTSPRTRAKPSAAAMKKTIVPAPTPSEKPFVILPDPEPEQVVLIHGELEPELQKFVALLRDEENSETVKLDPMDGVQYRTLATEPSPHAIFESKPNYEFMVYRLPLDQVTSDGYLIIYINHHPFPESGIWGYFTVSQDQKLSRVELPFPKGLLAKPFLEFHDQKRIFRFTKKVGKNWIPFEYTWNGKAFVRH